MPLKAIDPGLLFTKNDKSDIRLGDLTKQTELKLLPKKSDLVVLGYPDDEGVKLVGGRLGAAAGPDTIRKYFYKMTQGLSSSKAWQIFDLGNIDVGESLPKRHDQGQSVVHHLCERNHFWISLGGGHDYGFSDCSGFLASKKPSAAIINFDAHFDVRSTDKGLSSGTPFFRILNEYSDFSFFEVGIQPQCNSKHHLEFLKSKKAQVFFYDAPLINVVKALKKQKIKNIFLSIDIDYFSSTLAPGCSQSWPLGQNDLPGFLNFLNSLFAEFNICGAGIYEVSPALDVQDQTSKLAAVLMHQLLTFKAANT
jgi:formiminoglutamase